MIAVKYDLKLGMLRKNAGYTQSEAAEKLGISRSALAAYEKDSDNMPLSVLIKMSELYDFDIYSMTGIKEEGIVCDVHIYYYIKAHAMYTARHSCINKDEYNARLEEFVYASIKEYSMFNTAELLREFEKDKEQGIFKKLI